MPQYTDQEIIDAIRRSDGTARAAARVLGCHRETIARRVKDSSAIAEALREANDCTTDEAVGQLKRAIKRGKAWAIKFWLATQGRHAGFTTSMTANAADRSASVIIVRDQSQIPEPTGDGMQIILPDNGRGGLRTDQAET
ncbi:helix-turn-helix domain-containing protein [Planctomycetes bacterium TBK1r]|uniref:Uncharacterized protein n=1 Tax=Stieleria magnilauensis TaxID=2527963 RepID=A0ABX5Y2N4_9BACT|nr:hypothetical protein TBK1r_75710 [Planctomycetes bacterium TBK1r]